jgi:hypothetical protein
VFTRPAERRLGPWAQHNRKPDAHPGTHEWFQFLVERKGIELANPPNVRSVGSERRHQAASRRPGHSTSFLQLKLLETEHRHDRETGNLSEVFHEEIEALGEDRQVEYQLCRSDTSQLRLDSPPHGFRSSVVETGPHAPYLERYSHRNRASNRSSRVDSQHRRLPSEIDAPPPHHHPVDSDPLQPPRDILIEALVSQPHNQPAG